MSKGNMDKLSEKILRRKMLENKYNPVLQHMAHCLGLPFESAAKGTLELIEMDLVTYRELDLLQERIKNGKI